MGKELAGSPTAWHGGGDQVPVLGSPGKTAVEAGSAAAAAAAGVHHPRGSVAWNVEPKFTGRSDSKHRVAAAAASNPCVLLLRLHRLLLLSRRRRPQFLREGPPPLLAFSSASPSLLSLLASGMIIRNLHNSSFPGSAWLLGPWARARAHTHRHSPRHIHTRVRARAHTHQHTRTRVS